MILVEITPITLNVPNYVWWIFSAGVIAVVFFSGYQWSKLREICAQFPKIRYALDIISQLLCSHKWTDTPPYISAGSPYALTPDGKKMLEESNFEEFYKANKKNLFSFIEARNPKSPATVEMAAREAMLYLDPKSTPKMELIENFAYSKGRPVGDVLFAYAIEIRDRYLNENPITP